MRCVECQKNLTHSTVQNFKGNGIHICYFFIQILSLFMIVRIN